MNTEQRREILIQLITTLTAMLEAESFVDNNSILESENKLSEEKIEFLTIKQAVEAVSGISEHTIRQLVAQKKVKFIRTGQGKRGKILINKASLLAYCNNSSH